MCPEAQLAQFFPSKSQQLVAAERAKRRAATAMNERSSRAHAIVTVSVRQQDGGPILVLTVAAGSKGAVKHCCPPTAFRPAQVVGRANVCSVHRRRGQGSWLQMPVPEVSEAAGERTECSDFGATDSKPWAAWCSCSARRYSFFSLPSCELTYPDPTQGFCHPRPSARQDAFALGGGAGASRSSAGG